MKKNKLFKAHISDMMKIDVRHFYSIMHEKEKQKKEIQEEISKNSKYHKGCVILAGGIGLLTIGMAITNNYDVYKIDKDIIHASFVTTLFAGAISSKIYKHLNELINQHFKMLKDPISYKHEQFEKKLVEYLNEQGHPTEYQYISTIDDYFELKNISKNSENYEKELHQKTTKYVEKIINAYIEPDVARKNTIKQNKP